MPTLAAQRSGMEAQSEVGRLCVGRDQPLDAGWKFFRGSGEGLEAPGLDDAHWRALDLPHDWSIEDLPSEAGAQRVGPFDPAVPDGAAVGYTTGGEGWYRKRLHAVDLPSDCRVEILFEGAYCVTDVWLNGVHLGGHVHGYTPFGFDLTTHLEAGENLLAIRVRNIGQNSRWYAGSGLYRGVRLDVTAQAPRIARWGVAVATRRIAGDAAEIAVETTLAEVAPGLTLSSRIRSPDGRVVAESASAADGVVRHTLSVSSPRLWSPDQPQLYALESELRDAGGGVVDTVLTSFGVRIVTFDAQGGMRINGVETKLRGGCVHHDNGLLGAAAYSDSEDRRVRLLKARGYNAIRSAHYPCSRAFAEACDRHGILLIEEAFDMWLEPKTPEDYSIHLAANWKADLAAMVLSARNHPSVIMWSIGNEVPGRSTPEGVELQWRLANEVHTLDPTRPVTAAINAFPGRPVVADDVTAPPGTAGVPAESAVIFLDVVGYNYRLEHYARDHVRYPGRVLYGSESYPKEVFDIWRFTEAHPYVVGDFVWTAMDYLGEAGLGHAVRNETEVSTPAMPGWPWIGGNCGDLDLTGRQKPQSLARDVAWGISPLEIAVLRPLPPGVYEHVNLWGWSDELQSWTWPEWQGRPLTVRIYTQADRVELQVNGRVVADRTLGDAERLPIELTTPYEPGVLEAIAFRAGREIGRRRLQTAGRAAALHLAPEALSATAAPGRLLYIGVEVHDGHGHPVPDGEHLVQLTITGPAHLIGFGGGSPCNPSSFQSHAAQTYQGHALIVLRSTGMAGTVVLEAQSKGLPPSTATLRLA